MANDLALSKTITHALTEEDARSSLLKSASRIGKAYVDKNGEVVVRPRSGLHRVKIKTELDRSQSGSPIVTYSGSVGLSFAMGLMSLVFMAFMMLTIIGILVFFYIIHSSRKLAANSFKDVSSNAIEALM